MLDFILNVSLHAVLLGAAVILMILTIGFIRETWREEVWPDRYVAGCAMIIFFCALEVFAAGSTICMLLVILTDIIRIL